ncbi:MAG: cbb3-type cytochrome c oxidase subunit 3 [Planctomycetota bacterium]
MLKDIMGGSGLTVFATAGLVIFVIVFVGITVWALTRKQRKIDQWSRIPLTKDDEPPIEDREKDAERSAPNGAA